MKQVLLVKTCDGPILFKMSSKKAAINMAREQVMYNDLSSYSYEDRQEVSLAWSSNGKTGNLFELLRSCGVIEIMQVN